MSEIKPTYKINGKEFVLKDIGEIPTSFDSAIYDENGTGVDLNILFNGILTPINGNDKIEIGDLSTLTRNESAELFLSVVDDYEKAKKGNQKFKKKEFE